MIHQPKDGPALVSAVQQAQPGDEIVLTPGVRYVVGTLTMPVKPVSDHGILIRTSATLPERRIGPADAALMPVIASGNIGPSVTMQGVEGWEFRGIQFEPTSTGYGEIVVVQDSAHISFMQCLIVAGPNGQKRGIRGNGRYITVRMCHIAGIFGQGQDSQAFCAWDGAGPYTLIDNYFEAASENVMFGGANSQSAASIPADILVEGNTFYKRPEWKGTGKVVKNLFELKSAKRVQFRNNVLENNWTDAQNGYGILVTVRNDEGQSPHSCVEDVLIEKNVLKGSENGINVLGYDMYQPSGRTTRIIIRDNELQITGKAFQVGGEIGSLAILRNKVTGPPADAILMGMYAGDVWPAGENLPAKRLAKYAVQSFAFTGNTAPSLTIHGDGVGSAGDIALKTFALAYTTTSDTPPGVVDPPIDPPVDPVDIVGPDVRIAVLNRQGKSHNWNLRADSEATDIASVEFYVNAERKPRQTVTSAPYATVLSLKGLSGDVTVKVKAIDTAGNIGTASRTLVLV